MQELTRIRNERGWTQKQLSAESGVDKATINQVERGRRSPNVETLEKLARAMDVEVGDFFPKAQASLWSDEPAERRVEVAAWAAYVSRRASRISARVHDPDNPAFSDARTAMLFVEEANRECADLIRTISRHGPGEDLPFDGAPLDDLLEAFSELGAAIGAAQVTARVMEISTPEDALARKKADKAEQEREAEMERLSEVLISRAS